VNRLEDTLLLWKAIVSSKLLTKTTLIVFLNKCDLLKRCDLLFLVPRRFVSAPDIKLTRTQETAERDHGEQTLDKLRQPPERGRRRRQMCVSALFLSFWKLFRVLVEFIYHYDVSVVSQY